MLDFRYISFDFFYFLDLLYALEMVRSQQIKNRHSPHFVPVMARVGANLETTPAIPPAPLSRLLLCRANHVPLSISTIYIASDQCTCLYKKTSWGPSHTVSRFTHPPICLPVQSTPILKLSMLPSFYLELLEDFLRKGHSILPEKCQHSHCRYHVSQPFLPGVPHDTNQLHSGFLSQSHRQLGWQRWCLVYLYDPDWYTTPILPCLTFD